MAPFCNLFMERLLSKMQFAIKKMKRSKITPSQNFSAKYNMKYCQRYIILR